MRNYSIGDGAKGCGDGHQFGCHAFKVQLENVRQQLLVAENDRDQAKLNLIRAIGLSFDVTLTLTDEMSLVAVPDQTIAEALAVAQEHRTELKVQRPGTIGGVDLEFGDE